MTSTKPEARRGARALVLQGLYQRQLSRNADDAIRLQLLESEDYASADAEYLAAARRVGAGIFTLGQQLTEGSRRLGIPLVMPS
mgnify:CR=1 FL=1